MDKYKDLLTDVTDDILGKIEEQDTLNIFSLGDLSGMLDNNTNQEEFEIVSYLVIKQEIVICLNYLDQIKLNILGENYTKR